MLGMPRPRLEESGRVVRAGPALVAVLGLGSLVLMTDDPRAFDVHHGAPSTAPARSPGHVSTPSGHACHGAAADGPRTVRPAVLHLPHAGVGHWFEPVHPWYHPAPSHHSVDGVRVWGNSCFSGLIHVPRERGRRRRWVRPFVLMRGISLARRGGSCGARADRGLSTCGVSAEPRRSRWSARHRSGAGVHRTPRRRQRDESVRGIRVRRGDRTREVARSSGSGPSWSDAHRAGSGGNITAARRHSQAA